MVSERELKHLGLIGLKTLLHISFWNYLSTNLGVVRKDETLAQNHNQDDPLPGEFNVRPEHVSKQVSGYSHAHL